VQTDEFSFIVLTQQSLFKQSLHISPDIQYAMDRHGCTVDAIDNSVWLESDFSELRDIDVLQLWRYVTPKRQSAERVTSSFESLKQSISRFDGIVQRNIPVDFKEVFFSITIELNITPFHF
jgi:hypothetical protein